MKRNASVVQNRGEPEEESWPSKFTGRRLRAGDTIEITVPNSGAYGDPLERDPQLVWMDVMDGFTTVALARHDYGVVIDPATRTLDGEATERLRKRCRSERETAAGVS